MNNTPIKRAVAALSLAGAALGLASTAAQAAPLPDLPDVPVAGIDDITELPAAGVPDVAALTEDQLKHVPDLPAGQVADAAVGLVEDPKKTLDEAEFATVAADEALGTTLTGTGPAFAPPVDALRGFAAEGVDSLG
ncbi:hypothetical protein [Streptomyces sp. NPDC101132]|uniref:hypothetical protein n=1 Tax=Streptomyces sp. NPDC101132 TaxID=3366110 RepID=UPI0037F1DFB5